MELDVGRLPSDSFTFPCGILNSKSALDEIYIEGGMSVTAKRDESGTPQLFLGVFVPFRPPTELGWMKTSHPQSVLPSRITQLTPLPALHPMSPIIQFPSTSTISSPSLPPKHSPPDEHLSFSHDVVRQ